MCGVEDEVYEKGNPSTIIEIPEGISTDNVKSILQKELNTHCIFPVHNNAIEILMNKIESIPIG